MTDPVLCDRTYLDVTREVIDLGHTDSKGRRIGAFICRHKTVCEANGKTSGYRHVPGTYYGYRPGGARDGQHYGALQTTHFFATEEEREAAIQKYLAGARKRAAKIR